MSKDTVYDTNSTHWFFSTSFQDLKETDQLKGIMEREWEAPLWTGFTS